jgi:thioesterase domain-containing protein
MNDNLFQYKLPTKLYRPLLLLTDSWGDRAAPGSLLIKCHKGGEDSPLFWCGTPDTLASFYSVMGHERSIYCLCSTFGVLPPSEENIRAFARYYAAEIIKVQPQGPYVLGGFCEAGLISYEIAKLMYEKGYQVGMLFLFDRDVTQTDVWLKLARRLFSTIDRVPFRWEQARENPVQCIKEILLNKWQRLVKSPLQYVKSKLGFVSTWQAGDTSGYKLTPYPGKIHLVYVSYGIFGYFKFSFFQRYWRHLALGGIEYRIIPGNTHNNPNWPLVAKSLRIFIKEAGI